MSKERRVDSRADELMEQCEECKKNNKNFTFSTTGCKIEICRFCRFHRATPYIPRKHRNYDKEEGEVE